MCGALSSPTSFTFQLTAARRRLESSRHGYGIGKPVSTHSRPKAAGYYAWLNTHTYGVSTHSRPKAAGEQVLAKMPKYKVSTHSRPKAAGSNTRTIPKRHAAFQLTAARRRLAAGLAAR